MGGGDSGGASPGYRELQLRQQREQAAKREADALFGGRKRKPAEAFVGLQGSASVAALNAWWPRAAVGQEFIVCEALAPIRDETWVRAGQLAQQGYIRTHERKRAGGGKQYFAVRTAKRLEQQRDPIEAALADEATAIIWRALKRAANFRDPCPTDAELARAAGLDIRQKAAARVRKLAELKLIQSQLLYDGGVPQRVVTICAGKHAGASGGKRTALPRKWAALSEAAEREGRASADADLAQMRRRGAL